MEPILKGRKGKPKGSISRYVSLGLTGVSITKDLYEKLGKPNYLEVYKDGSDMVCVPREVDGANHLKHINIKTSTRGYYYCKTLSEHFNLGKFIFILKLDKTLIVKNCVKRMENAESSGKSGRRPAGRPRKNIFR